MMDAQRQQRDEMATRAQGQLDEMYAEAEAEDGRINDLWG